MNCVMTKFENSDASKQTFPGEHVLTKLDLHFYQMVFKMNFNRIMSSWRIVYHSRLLGQRKRYQCTFVHTLLRGLPTALVKSSQ